MARRKRSKFEWHETPSYKHYDARLRARDRRLQRTYGISLEEYFQKLVDQDAKCALCLRHESNFKTSLAVDHNHKTGQVRGLLCYACNKFRVGRNNIATTAALYAYMQKYEGGE